MFCRNPYVIRGHAFGCGQCVPCRVNRRRVWTHRIMLEAAGHEHNTFLTLTYNDENLPENGTLIPRDLTLFLKRLRAKVGEGIRYYAVGEYGDKSERPHYHAAMFGLQGCRRTVTSPNRKGYCCDICELLSQLWGKGNVFSGTLTSESAGYIAGYVTKKLTHKDDPRLGGRYPEFARMSLKPGIGLNMMDEVASTLLQHDFDGEDVPTSLQHGRNKWPLGRYLRRNLRKRIGRDEKTPQSVLDKMEEEMQPLRQAAKSIAPQGHKQFLFKQLVIDAGEGRARQMEARAKRKGHL